jgi:hypothetical protein
MSLSDNDWERERDKKNFEKMISDVKSVRSNHKNSIKRKFIEFLIIIFMIIIAFLFVEIYISNL